MKAIRAIFRRAMRDQVIDALADVPRHSAIGVGDITEFARHSETGELIELEMTRLEVEVQDERVEAVRDVIKDAARTAGGHRGDGKILVLALEDWSTIGEGD